MGAENVGSLLQSRPEIGELTRRTAGSFGFVSVGQILSIRDHLLTMFELLETTAMHCFARSLIRLMDSRESVMNLWGNQ